MQVTVPACSNKRMLYTQQLGHQLIRSVEVHVGGQLIEKVDAEWSSIWHSMTHKAERVPSSASS